ncbi:hypothetical protein BRC97_03910 [Halobacteriales archaeon QS_6_71_20]|nr:MAG: hypothetical protein BRC97_03910 [Halobacteriales archaeon QS_6_71_20]
MSDDPVTFDSVLDLCRHQHRRTVLVALAEERAPVTLDELTRRIVEYDDRSARRMSADGVSEDVRISLLHVHLPKLASEGFVTHDRDRQVVEPTERFERARPTVSRVLAADPALKTPIEP